MRLKSLLLLLVLLATMPTRAAEVLVVISPDRAGPGAFIDGTPHGTWVAWPPKNSASGANRILSLFTGINWDIQESELRFKQQDGRWVATEFKSLEDAGLFDAKSGQIERPLYVLSEGDTATSRLIALSRAGPSPPKLTMDKPWPQNSVIVAELSSWDLVSQVASKAGGRVLVVEYPPISPNPWSKFYFRGKGWPPGVPSSTRSRVPGFFPAYEVANLLLRPLEFTWTEDASSNWGGASRWLSFVGYYSPLSISVLMSFGFFFVGSTVYLFSRQEPARLGSVVCRLIPLLPSAILASGPLTLLFGRALFGVILPCVFLFEAVIASVLHLLLSRRWRSVHPLYSVAVVGLAACLAGGSTWSIFSESFGRQIEAANVLATATVFTHVAGVLCLGRGNFLGAWCARLITVAVLLVSAIGLSYWCTGWLRFAVPLVLLAVSEGWFRTWLLPIIFGAFAGVQLYQSEFSFTWAPGDLYESYRASRAFNLAHYAEFFLSPAFVCVAALLGSFALFIDSYFMTRARAIGKRDFRVRRLFQCSFACSALGLAAPNLLFAALFMFCGAFIALLCDRSWTI